MLISICAEITPYILILQLKGTLLLFKNLPKYQTEFNCSQNTYNKRKHIAVFENTTKEETDETFFK